MPENEVTETQDVQAQETTLPAETKMEKFERERMSRRAALKKMGVTSALSVFALFSVDDLARMVGKKMEQRASDNQVAEQLAKEFHGLQKVGLVFADSSGGGGVNPTDCSNSVTHYEDSYNNIASDYNNCVSQGGSPDSCAASTNLCSRLNDAAAAFKHSCPAHCPTTICRAQQITVCTDTISA